MPTIIFLSMARQHTSSDNTLDAISTYYKIDIYPVAFTIRAVRSDPNTWALKIHVEDSGAKMEPNPRGKSLAGLVQCIR